MTHAGGRGAGDVSAAGVAINRGVCAPPEAAQLHLPSQRPRRRPRDAKRDGDAWCDVSSLLEVFFLFW